MPTLLPRKFLAPAALVIALGVAPGLVPLASQPAPGSPGVSPALTKWLDPLPIPPVATTVKNNLLSVAADYYEITMTQHAHQFHSQLGNATVWTYGVNGQPGVYAGPTIVARQGRPVIVKWLNRLPNDPATFPLKDSIDPTIMGADLPTGRAIPHLHGGKTAARFDGTPDQWWTASGQRGSAYKTDTFVYTNEQPATMLWYHDHSMAATRFNPYLGLAAAYLIFDQVDTGTRINNQLVPSGAYQVPLVLQDKIFNADGTLYYNTQGNNAIHPIWVPEFFGDTPVVNGKAYPYLNVEPRRYRFRILNGSQARFYNLTLDRAGTPVPFHVIGSEQGLLPAPVLKTGQPDPNLAPAGPDPSNANGLLIGPGERFDVIADFTGLPAGTVLTLKNDAPAPYPSGGMPDIPELMRIVVANPLAGPDRSVPPASLKLPAIARLVPTPKLADREVVGEETEDPITGTPVVMQFNGYGYMDPVTDLVKAGTTETWDWINLTVDAHPMHMHLVSFQVLDRQALIMDPPDAFGMARPKYKAAWDAYLASGRQPALKPRLADYVTGPLLPPGPEEMGGKDTVKAYPGFVTRVRAKFELPYTSLLDLDPIHRSWGSYVYHCHILEHEENDMMRPFEVTF